MFSRFKKCFLCTDSDSKTNNSIALSTVINCVKWVKIMVSSLDFLSFVEFHLLTQMIPVKFDKRIVLYIRAITFTIMYTWSLI